MSSSLHKRLMQSGASSAGLPPKLPGAPSSARGHDFKRYVRDYAPLQWDNYFQRKIQIQTEEGDTFRVYESGEEGPVLVLLHGGGFSGLTWALMAKEVSSKVKCRSGKFCNSFCLDHQCISKPLLL